MLGEEYLATITDVAKLAGVSPVTVSRVINDAPLVNLKTRARVEQAIRELGYVPNVAAASLRSKRTRSLALILPDVTNTFWTTVARGVEDTAQSRGYSVFLCNTDEDLAKQARYLEFVTSQRVDGVVIAPCGRDAGNLARLRDRDIRTVIVDRCIDGWETDTVRGDSLSGAYALVKHLISLRHRRIAIISGPHNTSTAEDRVTGYCIALSEAGIAPDPRLIQRGEFRTTSGEELAYQLLDEQPRPTAIFAANNAIAMGVIDAAAKRGLRIPQDLALVCFDDLPSISHLFPFLTVVVQPVYEMGVNAAQLLLSRLDAAAPLDPRHIVLPTRMILRHSCGARLHKNGHLTLSLPLPLGADEESIPITSLDVAACHTN
jgi:LacI family transcriptional regulator